MSTHNGKSTHVPAAATAVSEHGHGHGAHGHGADHEPHVLPIQMYLATFGALLVLTVVTVAASYVDLGTSWNLLIALLIATAKASVVAAIFMHLYYDHKFHAIIFASSVIFLGIFILFTMFDTETRGRTDAIQAERPVDVTNPFGGSRAEAELKARYEKLGLVGEPPAAPPGPGDAPPAASGAAAPAAPASAAPAGAAPAAPAGAAPAAPKSTAAPTVTRPAPAGTVPAPR